jgi:hypothetical protein
VGRKEKEEAWETQGRLLVVCREEFLPPLISGN